MSIGPLSSVFYRGVFQGLFSANLLFVTHGLWTYGSHIIVHPPIARTMKAEGSLTKAPIPQSRYLKGLKSSCPPPNNKCEISEWGLSRFFLQCINFGVVVRQEKLKCKTTDSSIKVSLFKSLKLITLITCCYFCFSVGGILTIFLPIKGPEEASSFQFCLSSLSKNWNWSVRAA